MDGWTDGLMDELKLKMVCYENYIRWMDGWING